MNPGEWKIMSQKVIIYYTLELSDHDSYCSGNECEYSIKNKIFEVDIENPVIDRDDEGLIKNQDDFIRLIPKPSMGHPMNSHCCRLSEESVAHNLGRHEYRITVDDVLIQYGKNPYSQVVRDNPYS